MTKQYQKVLLHLVPKRLAITERSWTNADGSITTSYRARIYLPSKRRGAKHTYKTLSASNIDEAIDEAKWLWKSLGNVDDITPRDVHIERPQPKVYFIREVGTELVKIGKSFDPEARLKTLQIGTPHKLELMHIIDSEIKDENWFHQRLSKFHVLGEWYQLDDLTIEAMLLLAMDVENIESLRPYNDFIGSL